MTGLSQRGYNIVEMAIALAVLGLLLAGAIMPLQRYYEAENNRETVALLDAARSAVAAYAVRHRTVARRLESHGGFHYALPAGRPYLPCPDIDNDGAEDRMSAIDTTVQSADLLSMGGCVEQKGALPWKTLGLPDTDSWGNRLTYLADEAFSNALIGFDGKTRADIFDPRKPIIFSSSDERYALRDDQDKAGAIICSRIDVLGGCANNMPYNIHTGVAVSVSIEVGARFFDNTVVPKGVVEGMPFVIVSHGRNGYGAINRNGKCRDLTAGNVEEQENAYLNGFHYLVTVTSPPCLNNHMLGGVVSNFVSHPAGKGEDSFDDIVVWMSADQLMGVLLRGGTFPVSPLEFLPDE